MSEHSRDWDYTEKQKDEIFAFFVIKYREWASFLIKKTSLFYQSNDKFNKIIVDCDSTLKKINVDNETILKFKNSMTCPACFYSFMEFEHIMDHLVDVHLTKLGYDKSGTNDKTPNSSSVNDKSLDK